MRRWAAAAHRPAVLALVCLPEWSERGALAGHGGLARWRHIVRDHKQQPQRVSSVEERKQHPESETDTLTRTAASSLSLQRRADGATTEEQLWVCLCEELCGGAPDQSAIVVVPRYDVFSVPRGLRVNQYKSQVQPGPAETDGIRRLQLHFVAVQRQSHCLAMHAQLEKAAGVGPLTLDSTDGAPATLQAGDRVLRSVAGRVLDG